MISVTGKNWEEKKINKNSVEKLKQDHSFSEILSKLIVSRNFDQNEIHLIENDLELSNLFHYNKDFTDSIKLTENVINNGEKVNISIKKLKKYDRREYFFNFLMDIFTFSSFCKFPFF